MTTRSATVVLVDVSLLLPAEFSPYDESPVVASVSVWVAVPPALPLPLLVPLLVVVLLDASLLPPKMLQAPIPPRSAAPPATPTAARKP